MRPNLPTTLVLDALELRGSLAVPWVTDWIPACAGMTLE